MPELSDLGWLRRNLIGNCSSVASFGNSGFLVADTALPAALPGVAGKVPGWLADPVGPFAVKPGYAAPWLARFLFASRKAQIFRGSDALRPLHCSTFKHWQDLVGPETFGHLIRRNGQIYVWDGPKASPKSGCEDALRHRLGINFEILDQAQIQTMIPGVSSTISKGLLVPGNGHTVNPGRLVTGAEGRNLATGFNDADCHDDLMRLHFSGSPGKPSATPSARAGGRPQLRASGPARRISAVAGSRNRQLSEASAAEDHASVSILPFPCLHVGSFS